MSKFWTRDDDIALDEDHKNNLEIKYQHSQEQLKYKDYQLKQLQEQLSQQQQFMQTVIMELIDTIRTQPAPVVASSLNGTKPSLSSYLDKKANQPLSGPSKPLPG